VESVHLSVGEKDSSKQTGICGLDFMLDTDFCIAADMFGD
jgi:hypothetical protein